MGALVTRRKNNIITSQSTVQKPRTQQEITAMYNLKKEQYKELKMKGDSPETREQLLMVYSETKILGWVLGKDEKSMIKDMTY